MELKCQSGIFLWLTIGDEYFRFENGKGTQKNFGSYEYIIVIESKKYMIAKSVDNEFYRYIFKRKIKKKEAKSILLYSIQRVANIFR